MSTSQKEMCDECDEKPHTNMCDHCGVKSCEMIDCVPLYQGIQVDDEGGMKDTVCHYCMNDYFEEDSDWGLSMKDFKLFLQFKKHLEKFEN